MGALPFEGTHAKTQKSMLKLEGRYFILEEALVYEEGPTFLQQVKAKFGDSPPN